MDIILYTLLTTHITIICVTLYLHRSQTHRGIDFNPIVSHIMRFWLWLTTGMITKEWVAIHRLHHRHTETNLDPHSPKIYGIFTVLFKGALLYNKTAKDKVTISAYGVGTPDDYIERKLYTPHSKIGLGLLLLINILLFGWIGLFVWAVQMIWIPFWAAGVINGVGHYWGYRNGETKDNSKNIVPWDIIVGGECLHNNHHMDPGNPKLSRRWFEFDVGWLYFKLLSYIGLAKLRYGHQHQL